VDWQLVPGNVSQYDIVLPHGDDYKFGIALQSHQGWGSGILWSKCVFHANSSE